MALPWRDELEILLRPAAGGVHLVSTGRAAQATLQRALYGVDTDAAVRAQFLANLDRVPQARGGRATAAADPPRREQDHAARRALPAPDDLLDAAHRDLSHHRLSRR